MDGRFNNPFISEQEEEEEDPGITTTSSTPTLSSSPNNNSSSYSSSASAMAIHHDRSRVTSNSLSSPKKSSRRSIQKRVVSIPIGDVDGTRLKGEGAPPSDSWAWRKYGQKPIKGSPYPRGYYRCSSSKGCPARKQVERSRVDPTMLVITYACEHNHAWPASRNSTSTTNTAVAAAATTNDKSINITTMPEKFVPKKEPAVFVNQTEIEPDEKFADLGDESMITVDDFGWFSDVASTSATVLESPICLETSSSELDADLAMIFPMREEDESLFADLGELPECSSVFRRGIFEQEEERRRLCSSLRTGSWCESTG